MDEVNWKKQYEMAEGVLTEIRTMMNASGRFTVDLTLAEAVKELLATKPAQVVFRIGGKYNWRNQPERLTYLGRNWSGNGYWHQFEKVDAPGVVWCEVVDSDLSHFEETKPSIAKAVQP